MRLKRWQKVIVLAIIWIALVIGISVVLTIPFLQTAIIASIVTTVISLLVPRISDKILEMIFGKEEKPAELVRVFAEEKQKLEERDRRIKGLQDWIHEDSRELVDALRLFFSPPSADISVLPDFARLYYSLSFANVVYVPDGKSKPKINHLQEPWWIDPRLVDRIREHLADTDWKLWLGAKEAVNTHLEKVKALWENMEETLRSELLRNCPTMIEWYGGGHPPIYYRMDYCLHYIWSEVERAVTHNITPSLKYLQENPEDPSRVGIGTTYGKSPDSDTKSNFIKTMSGIMTQFVTRFQEIYYESKNIEETIERFRKSVDTRIYDFEHPPHYNLPNKCIRCRLLYEELDRLKSSA